MEILSNNQEEQPKILRTVLAVNTDETMDSWRDSHRPSPKPLTSINKGNILQEIIAVEGNNSEATSK